MTILTIAGIWLVASIVLAPIMGGVLRRCRQSQSIALPPLPSGSLVDKYKDSSF
jgi:hypothetical protein